MKLIALKKISAVLPKGATFDQPDRAAKMLIAVGVARKADDDATVSAPDPVSPPRRRAPSQRRDPHVGA